ncbi:TetR/AcrR family transcriptional regulator [Streptomyces sp. DSM 44915]|uniref:TetR/AcrR family transcriptional regulator n=1 Tax=Streptomyces chisholmiae TaxID=3075540 RepID=A0ABU2JTI4_9ACTN|nr:TetR/AcrR family transcriptional regulator [Streptomyces sp. DSM 44915]MDT0268301.1 TetR/AcrR family transcriptional regulator [Streptomyces sp. DSM 44915]
MARVSQEHLAARRRQILDGAARCFARDGFHGTSMQDVLRETGLSAGAVYRYFPSKDAIIAALAGDVLATVRECFRRSAESDDPPPPDALLAEALGRVAKRLVVPAPMLLQVWSETLRNPELRVTFQENFAALLGLWSRIVATYQRQGRMRPDVAPEAVARALAASAQGFLLQRALFGPVDEAVLGEGLRGLMSMTGPADAGSSPPRGAPAAGTPERP